MYIAYDEEELHIFTYGASDGIIKEAKTESQWQKTTWVDHRSKQRWTDVRVKTNLMKVGILDRGEVAENRDRWNPECVAVMGYKLEKKKNIIYSFLIFSMVSSVGNLTY